MPCPIAHVRLGRHRGGAWRASLASTLVFLLPFVVLGAPARTVAGGAPVSVTATIPVGSHPAREAVDAKTDTIYVANEGSDTVSVIDGATHEVTATIPVGHYPDTVAVDPETDTIYVVDVLGNTVSVIDGVTNQVTATIGGLSHPVGMAVDPDTDRIYVTNYYAATLSVIDGTTDQVTATVGVGSGAVRVGVDPGTDTIYVANQGSYMSSQGANTVSVIDGATNHVTATIAVGNDPQDLAVDPSTHRIYVADDQANAVSVIDGATNRVAATVAVGTAPVGVGVNPSSGMIYVANNAAASVSVIDGATNQMAGTIAVGQAPDAVAVDASTGTIYVANYADNDVSVINVQTSGGAAAVVASIPVGSHPARDAVDANTDTIYVVEPGANAVAVIDGATNGVAAAPIPVGNLPDSVAVDPETDRIYVTNVSDNTVSVIDGGTRQVIATIGGLSHPVGIAVDPGTDTIYVANFYAGTVAVIDGATNQVTRTIGVGNGAVRVAVDPSTHTIYVANEGSDVSSQGANTVSVIDGASQTVTATISVGSNPQGIAVDPGTRTIYVTNDGDNTVSVIDGATNQVTTTIAVGNGPYGAAVDPGTNTIYVADNGTNTLSVLDGVTNQVLGTTVVGKGPDGIAFDPLTSTLYVANYLDNTVSVVSVGAPAVTTAPDGSGSVTVSPATVSAGTAGNTLNFTYTAAAGGISDGEVDITVPAGWTPPRATSGGAGLTTASTGNVSVTGQTIRVTDVTLGSGATFTVTYADVTVPSAVGSAPIVAEEKSSGTGTLTAVGNPPQITVAALMRAVTTGGAFQDATAIAVDAAGNLYVADSGVHSILRVAPDGEVTPLRIPDYALQNVTGLAVDAAGDLYIVDQGTNAVLKASVPSYGVQPLCPSCGYSSPTGVAVDGSGNVYVSDQGHGRILKVDPQGHATVLAIGLQQPAGVALRYGGDLYVADAGDNAVVEISPASGQEIRRVSVDKPVGVAVDAAGLVYVAEGADNRIVLTNMLGHFATVADAAVGVDDPRGLALDAWGDLYIVDPTEVIEAPDLGYSAVADGSGWLTVLPTSVRAGTSGNTLTFTYRTALGIGGGEVDIAVPAGWTPPTPPAPGGPGLTAASTGTVSVSGQVIRVRGVSLDTGEALTVTYGQGGGSTGVTIPDTSGTAVFTALEKSSANGALKPLSNAPSVAVLPPDGSGSLTVSPATVTEGAVGNTLTFTYTAAAGGISGGEVDVTIPDGWTMPGATPGSPGFTTVSAGSVSVRGATIEDADLTLGAGDTLTLTYGSGEGAGVAVPANPGTATFMASEKSVPGGTLTLLATAPSVSIVSPSGNGSGNGSGAAPTATNLTLANASGVAGGTAELRATLTAAGSPLSGRSIAFTVDGRSVGAALTSGAGIATVTASLAGLSAGTSYPVTASFAGDQQDQASAAAAWLVDTNPGQTAPGPLSVGTTALPTATLGTPYAAILLPAGGVPPYTWSLIGGSLPAGLGLNTVTGQVYGTPTAVGTSRPTFLVSDASVPTPQTATVGLTLTVETPQPLSDLTVGVNPAVGGATATYTIGFVAPSGLSVGQAVYLAAPTGTVFPAGAQDYLLADSVSQAVYGGGGATVRIAVPQGLAIPAGGSVTATVYGVRNPGAGTYTLRAWTTADPAPATSASYSLAAGGAGALSITVSNLPSGIVNEPYSASLTASGGTPPYRWTVSSGSLPPGLQLDEATGVISGTPTTVRSYEVTLQVEDASSPSQSAGLPAVLTVGSGGAVSPGLEAQGYLTPAVIQADAGQAGLEVGVQAVTGSGGGTEMLAGFQATLSYDASHVQVLDVYCLPAFKVCAFHIDRAAGTVSIAAATATAADLPADVAFVAMRVTGSVTENTAVSLTVQAVADQNDITIPASGPVSATLQRGAVANTCSSTGQPLSGLRAVGIGDAVAGLQFLVGLKTAGTGCGQVNPVNLASLVPSSYTSGATPGIGNVVALLRYLVHLVGPHMNPLPARTS